MKIAANSKLVMIGDSITEADWLISTSAFRPTRLKGENSIMSIKKETTLRLNMPQWQGGNVHDYYFGSQLLAWLAPAANGPVETVPVPEPKPGETLEVENGIVGRAAPASCRLM